ncbi:rod-determining factor RdfA [Halorarius halobius]|uniref:rod-determining factor RdfA n=1 Tax=Halorarius halobius TaxID=2962671 RepID=UPI0020CF0999|nr:rod-determining factor RdfA [Halorarius halobius]
MDEGATSRSAACDCKVGRVLHAHGLEELAAELPARWRGTDGESESVRELARVVNRRVLTATMREAGLDPLSGDVETTYRTLAGEAASAGERTQLVNRLERQGVDVETVDSEFVSHQSVHRHLTDCLGVSRASADRSPAERRDGAADSVAALANRTAAVTEGSLTALRDADALALEGFDVFVDVTVTCESCGRVHAATALLDRGGCQCRLDEP